MSPIDLTDVLGRVCALLDTLEIRYVVGGSIAASLFGEPRTTYDIDLMVDVDEKQLRAMVTSLEEHFHVLMSDAVAALRERDGFNAIHIESAIKVDFFFARDDLSREQLTRREQVTIGGNRVAIYKVEDIIVRKLLWYQMGNQVSERQLRDVVRMLQVSTLAIDHRLLSSIAAKAGVSDLLERAIARAEDSDFGNS